MAGRTMDVATQAESAFVMWAVSKQYEVARPIHHAQGYDFVVRRSITFPWETVQVKAAYQGNNGRGKVTREVSLRRCNEKGSRPYIGEFDYLFVWDGMSAMWLFPWVKVKHLKSSLCLGDADHVNHADFMVML
ncbi:MAG: group I intron-associated PD-(D/E)XK endonuclease [Bryobacteraceae bacterium]